jgi:nucleolar protein 56
MRLLWDWRLARVLDSDGTIIDELIWDGTRGPGAASKRLGFVTRGRMTLEARDLHERFPDAAVDGVTSSAETIDWPPLEADEMALLDAAAIILSREAVAEAASDIDRRLEHLVDATTEMRDAALTIESRVVEWLGLFLAELDLDAMRRQIPIAMAAAANIGEVAEQLGVAQSKHPPLESEWRAMRDTATAQCQAAERLEAAERAIREHALEHLPSLSALLGPLLAAKLSVIAHGRARLARLPSSTLQVLGAEKAFFSHLRSGTPVPKHGMIFQHPWISRSPRWIRGKVARMLAGKATIAVRVDHFGGETWGTIEVGAVEQAVTAIRKRHPSPTKNRQNNNR